MPGIGDDWHLRLYVRRSDLLPVVASETEVWLPEEFKIRIAGGAAVKHLGRRQWAVFSEDAWVILDGVSLKTGWWFSGTERRPSEPAAEDGGTRNWRALRLRLRSRWYSVADGMEEDGIALVQARRQCFEVEGRVPLSDLRPWSLFDREVTGELIWREVGASTSLAHVEIDPHFRWRLPSSRVLGRPGPFPGWIAVLPGSVWREDSGLICFVTSGDAHSDRLDGQPVPICFEPSYLEKHPPQFTQW